MKHTPRLTDSHYCLLFRIVPNYVVFGTLKAELRRRVQSIDWGCLIGRGFWNIVNNRYVNAKTFRGMSEDLVGEVNENHRYLA